MEPDVAAPGERIRTSALDRGLTLAALLVAVLSLLISGLQAYPDIRAHLFPRPTCSAPGGLTPITGVSATASSTLPPAPGRTYDAANVVDGDATTAWAPRGGGGGVGKQLLLSLRPEARIALACVINGYARSADLYARNARPRDVTVETRAGTATGTLINESPDNSNQFQDLPIRAGSTGFVRLTVNTFYSGVSANGRNSYLDACVSELLLYRDK